MFKVVDMQDDIEQEYQKDFFLTVLSFEAQVQELLHRYSATSPVQTYEVCLTDDCEKTLEEWLIPNKILDLLLPTTDQSHQQFPTEVASKVEALMKMQTVDEVI